MTMERSPAGPRIYVPVNMPDQGTQPTYAVLEFVGFSSPAPSSNAHLLHSSTSPTSVPPAMLYLPSTVPSTSRASPSSSFLPLPPNSPQPLPPPQAAVIPTVTTPQLHPIPRFLSENSTLLLPCSSSHNPQTRHQLVTARYELMNVASPPSSPSCNPAPSCASSSASRESFNEKTLHASIPPPFDNGSSMETAGAICIAASKPVVALSNSPADACPKKEDGLIQTQVSVSQSDRETVVHTHSSNFRDVVRQLTGASSNDRDLLPVTLPTRLANRMHNASIVQNPGGGAEAAPAAVGGTPMAVTGGLNGGTTREQLGLRRAPMKLHERRKSSMKNLEKVTTEFSFHGGGGVLGVAPESSPIANRSPVTPLASDFERFCSASTPTSQGSSGISSPICVMTSGALDADEVSRTAEQGNQTETSGRFFLQQRPSPTTRLPLSPLEKGPKPILLSLFPESPACSPRER
ncbi:hypothetical protein KP509_05G039800 [Ceratopteris richardii]|uniref:VQ domain-containing protein n=1 Tax=Ceratopteris richardii TaxID=49495 RepID=A0A8T2UTE5_CERRI|nr:hypothetical protein KP509_05G039800 [Ceratopteris richardii]